MQDGSCDEADVTRAAEVDVCHWCHVGRSADQCEVWENGGGVDGAHDLEGDPVVVAFDEHRGCDAECAQDGSCRSAKPAARAAEHPVCLGEVTERLWSWSVASDRDPQRL